ncbi:MAG: hypothetical protein AAFR11_03870 [Pseudomonadota bacterium]
MPTLRRQKTLFAFSLAAFVATAASTASAAALRQSASDVALFRGEIVQINLDIDISGADVYIDGAYATAFAAFSSRRVDLRFPFPRSAAPVTIAIISSETGELLHEGRYRRPRRGEVFDSVETEIGGQLDANGTASPQTVPEPDPLRRYEGEASGRLTSSISGTRGAFSTSLSTEFVGVSDEFARLREGGSAVDLSRGVAELRYASGLADVALTAGDIQTASPNELVSSGITSRGIALGADLFGGRLRAGAAHAFGSDVVGLVRGPIGWSSNSRRVSGRIEGDILRSGPVGLSAHASYLYADRPSDENFGVGFVPDAETNRVLGAGLGLTALDGAFSYSLLAASSRYDNPANADPFGFVIAPEIDPGETRGDALRHQIDWSLWSGVLRNRPTSLNIAATLSETSPLFRSIQSFLDVDRRTADIDLSASHGKLRLGVRQRLSRNNLDDVPGILTTSDDAREIVLDLDTLNADGAPVRPWSPSSVSLSWRVDRTITLNGDVVVGASSLDGSELPDQKIDTVSARLNWGRDWGSIGTEYGFTALDNRQIGRAEADRRDHRLAVDFATSREAWSINGRIGVLYTDDRDPGAPRIDRGVELALEARFHRNALPHLSAGFDRSRRTSADRLQFLTDRTVASGYFATVDFGPWVAALFSLDAAPAVTLSWLRRDTETETPFFNDETVAETVSIAIGRSF